MRIGTRALGLLLAVLTVWCLGCDAFELVAKSFTTSTDVTAASAPSVETAGDDCHCVLGHVAVVVATSMSEPPAAAVGDFVDLPRAVLLPLPEPPLRPPVA
jgi:hypothetical protein